MLRMQNCKICRCIYCIPKTFPDWCNGTYSHSAMLLLACQRPTLSKTKCFHLATLRLFSNDSTQSCRQQNISLSESRENIMTIPNMLTLVRICCTPVIGYLVVEQSYMWSLGLFVAASVTDVLDGYIARNFANQRSAFGSAMDPLADKLLIATLTVTLTISGLLPVPLTALIVARDVALVAIVSFYRWKSLPAPRTIGRYFDPTVVTGRLQPTALSKANTAVQVALISLTLASPVFGFAHSTPLLAAQWITAATTMLSGLSYVFAKDAVQFVNKRR